ncbi:Metallo-hydrolase/oxidoreductase [Aspergillus steynii IBT 23096]|uniref:Metallo-hydrolase/oxidoreductase n=1 Tax=Aspergillus steynii IBT 23096 TaxID=1392250 RepID=A0A2I2GEX7_9EURO|nr:Metallo-hydrolase/oxidoreductase [Aspergillus steynii IBT 23096]PLB51438.1 Metallo-hydrolase/oxidoreductase [Aspergillus steynii IBT 23096]
MADKEIFPVPPGDTPITVKLINPVNAGPAILNRFMEPQVPGLDTFESFPSLCFLLEHPSGRKLVWDLGIRKDYWNYAPKIAEYIPTTKYHIEVEKNVADILEDHDVKGEDIEAVIWSHWHWDHIGDPSTFPASTDLIVGPGFKEALLPGAPANPDSPILESDYTSRNLREISFNGANALKIGKFNAFDYFGDGSFHILDSPGHAVGHLCGLARTTTSADTFILLGGDVCHFAGIFRPSTHLPLPDRIIPHPISGDGVGFCPGGAWEELQKSRGRESTQSLYDPTFGHDIPLAKRTIEKLQEADASANVFVIIAHDAQVKDGVPHFPKSLNRWKDEGWGSALKWAFLKVLGGYWREKGVADG